MNLYGMVGNDALNFWDVLGLAGHFQKHHWIPQDGGRNKAKFENKCDLDIHALTTNLWSGNGEKTAAHNVGHTKFKYDQHVNSLLNDPEIDCCAFLQAVKSMMEITQQVLAVGAWGNKVDRGGDVGSNMPNTVHYKSGDDTTGLIDKWIDEKCRCPGGKEPVGPKVKQAVSKYQSEAFESIGFYDPTAPIEPSVGPPSGTPEGREKLREDMERFHKRDPDRQPMVVPTPNGPEVRPGPFRTPATPGPGRGRGGAPPRSPFRMPARIGK